MMKVGWIYPFRKRCGIRSYGENYVNILKNKIEIITLNPEHFLTLYKFFKDEIKKCDIVHIQYEPSIFWKASKNFYLSLINT
ncbi:MAG: hypothetical protein N2053_09385, partial [Chitinispirillaceae bacterium]|nr:hypothetical protein [Chitinispirillaceae bacterium]